MRAQDARTTILNLLAAVGRAPRDTLLRACGGDEALLCRLTGDLVTEGLALVDGDGLAHSGPVFGRRPADDAALHLHPAAPGPTSPVVIISSGEEGSTHARGLSEDLEGRLGSGACRHLTDATVPADRATAVADCDALLLVATGGWWEGACGRDVARAVHLGKRVVAVCPEGEVAPAAHPLLDGAPRADLPADMDRLTAYVHGTSTALSSGEDKPVLGVTPLSFAATIARHSVDFVARPRLRQEFETWLSWEDKCLLLAGEAGVGKTAFCAALAGDLPRLVVAAHFATVLDQATLEPREYVATLVTQLHRRLAGYSEALGGRRCDLPREPVAGLRDLVLAPLQAMEAPASPVVLLLDGAEDERLAAMLELLAKGLPGWVKLLIAARSETQIAARLKDVAVEGLALTSPAQRQDVRTYLDTAGAATGPGAPVETLSRLAGGSYLVAAQLTAALRDGAVRAEELAPLTPGLDGVLEGLLGLRSGESGGYGQAPGAALTALLVAQEPMPADVLAMCAGCPEDHLRSILAPVEWLLTVSGGGAGRCYSLAAEALAEWLGDAERAGRHRLEADRGHRQVADALAGRWGRCPYALRHLPSHLLAGGDPECAADLLTDLEFIEARCRAGLLPRLLAELAEVAAGLKEQDPEQEKRRLRDETVREYVADLTRHAELSTWWYASHWSRRARARLLGRGRPEPPPLSAIPSARPWTEEDLVREAVRVAAKSTLSERVAAVRDWLEAEGRHLALYGDEPGYCVQQAYASAADGPVPRMAGEILAAREGTIRLAATCRDRPPFEWRPACRAVLTGHSGAVYDVALSADGTFAASVGDDNVLRLWNLHSDRCERQVDERVRGARSVALTPDGQVVAYARSNGAIRVLETSSGRPVCLLDAGPRHIQALDITPDARLIACAGANGTVQVWDVDRERRLRALSGHESHVNAIAIAANGATVLTAGDDRTVRVWDVAEGACLCSMEGTAREVRALAITPQAAVALSAGGDGLLWLWDVESGRCSGEIEAGGEVIRAVALSADGQLAAAGGDDGLLRVYDTRSGRCIRELSGHTGPVLAVALTPDGRTAVSGGEDGSVRVWDVTRGETRSQAADAPMALNRQGHMEPRHMVARPVRTWDAGPAAGLADLQEHRAYRRSPDGKLSVSGRRDRRLRIFELSTGHCRHVLRGHSEHIAGVDISPDGRWAASAADMVRLWDLEHGRMIAVLPDSAGFSRAVSVSPDGRLVAGCGEGVRLWDALSGVEVATLSGDLERAEAIAFSADGRFLAAGGIAGTVVVWEMHSGRSLRVLRGSESYISAVAVSDRGEWVFAADGDAVLRLWDVAGGGKLSAVRLGAPAMGLRGRWSAVVATDSLGNVHGFNVYGPPDPQPVATVTRLWCFGDGAADGAWEEQRRVSCPWCETRFEPPDRALTALAGFRTAVGDLIASMSLPPAAWDDPRLEQTCPHCGLPLRLTPFCVDDSRVSSARRAPSPATSAVDDGSEGQETGHEGAQDGGGQTGVVDAQGGNQQRTGEGRPEGRAAEIGGVEPGGGAVGSGGAPTSEPERGGGQWELQPYREPDECGEHGEGHMPGPSRGQAPLTQ